MIEYTYDQIYGVDLNAYMDKLGFSLEDLVLKTMADIEFLKKNLRKEVNKPKENQDDYLITVIFNTINKKEKHLSRIIEWAKTYCELEYEDLKHRGII